jgi:flagellar biosynthesis component FlhA
MDMFKIKVNEDLYELYMKECQVFFDKQFNLLKEDIYRNYCIVLPDVQVEMKSDIETNHFAIYMNGELLDDYIVLYGGLVEKALKDEEKDEIFKIFGSSYNLPKEWLLEEKIDYFKHMETNPFDFIFKTLKDLIQLNIHLLIDLDFTKTLIEHNKYMSSVVDKGEIKLSLIQKVFQNLVREGIPIQQVDTICDYFIDFWEKAETKEHVDFITAYIRFRMVDEIFDTFKSEDGNVYGFNLENYIQTLEWYDSENEINGRMDKEELISMLEVVREFNIYAKREVIKPIVLVGDLFQRLIISKSLLKINEYVYVLSTEEFPEKTNFVFK